MSTPRSEGWPATVAAGLIIGAVETVLAVAFAAFVFGGLLQKDLPDGIGLYLFAAAVTVAVFAWRGGRRGVVGSVQDAAAAVLAGAAAAAAARAAQLSQIAALTDVENYEGPDVFLTVIAATLVVTVLCGVSFLVLGWRRWGSLIRFVPYPVVGGFLAGTGWLLFTERDLRGVARPGRPRPARRPGAPVHRGALAPGIRLRRGAACSPCGS